MRHWTEKDDRVDKPPDPDRALIRRFLLLALVPLTLGVVGGLFAGWLIWGRR